MMVDEEYIARMSFLIFVLDQVVIFDSGLIVDRDNFQAFISNSFDA